MSLDPLNDPATQREILHLRVCATVMGKLLIKQGVLKKDDIANPVPENDGVPRGMDVPSNGMHDSDLRLT